MDQDLERDDGTRANIIQEPGACPSLESYSTNCDESAPRRTDEQHSSKEKAWIHQILLFIRQQWFILALGLVILIASQAQVPASKQKLKLTIVTYSCVSLIFFVTGCTLKTRTLLENYSRWKVHLFVQMQCFLMTSAIIFGIVSACATSRDFMDPGLLLGMILTGCVATTITTNVVMTAVAGGNQALTVVESTTGNFLSPFLTPALFRLYTTVSPTWYSEIIPSHGGDSGKIYSRVFKQLGLALFLPMFIGQVIQNLFPKTTRKIFVEKKLCKLPPFAILIILWQTFDGAFSSGAFTSVKSSNIIFLVFMSIILYVVFLVVAFFSSIIWLSREDTIAVCYCVPAKSPALGLPLATVMFVGLDPQLEAKLQIPIVIYQGFQILAGNILTAPFLKWVRRGNRLVK